MMTEKNLPADSTRTYRPAEVAVDAAVHGIALAGSVAGGVMLILAAIRGGVGEIAVAAIYLSGLLAMFGCSAVYNLWYSSDCSALLRRLDHSAIFLMIAGSYTPFSALLLRGGWAVGMTTLVWSVATAGIAARLWLPQCFVRTRIVFYLALGWSGVVAIVPLANAVGMTTMMFLGAGGLLYTLGVVFHLWRTLPFQNAIWHAFVLAGASLHYVAVFNGVILAGERLHASTAVFA